MCSLNKHDHVLLQAFSALVSDESELAPDEINPFTHDTRSWGALTNLVVIRKNPRHTFAVGSWYQMLKKNSGIETKYFRLKAQRVIILSTVNAIMRKRFTRMLYRTKPSSTHIFLQK